MCCLFFQIIIFPEKNANFVDSDTFDNVVNLGLPDDLDVTSLKLPPHSVEAEQSVLGGVMIANDSWDKVADLVSAEDFYRSDHRQIYAHMARLVEASHPIDVITLSESLNNSGELEQVGGLN